MPEADAAQESGNSPISSYTTLLPGTGVRNELEIRRSRFITVLRRTGSEAEARAVVAGTRREFPDARHHCSAYILGPDRNVRRSSDDGEPSGTAGLPMLEALTRRETIPGGNDLSDVTAVVIRYFGGTLLGAGGLIRAYSDSVSTALDAAALVRRSRRRICSVEVPHAQAGRLENDLRTAGFVMAGSSYGGHTTVLRLALPDDPDSLGAGAARLQSLSAGSATLIAGATEWVDIPLP